MAARTKWVEDQLDKLWKKASSNSEDIAVLTKEFRLFRDNDFQGLQKMVESLAGCVKIIDDERKAQKTKAGYLKYIVVSLGSVLATIATILYYLYPYILQTLG